MKKMKGLFAIILAFAMFAAVAACVTEPVKGEQVLSSIVIATQPTKTSYTVGEVFDKTGMKVEAIYTVDNVESKRKDITSSVTFSAAALSESDTTVVISYTEASVTKTANIAIKVAKPPLDAEVVTIPPSTLKVKAQTGNKTATSSWFVSYEDNGMKIVAYVLDEEIKNVSSLFSSDGVEFFLGKIERVDGLVNGTLSINVTAKNAALVRKSTGGILAELADSKVVTSAKNITIENKKIDGYMVEVSVPYTAIAGVTKADKNASICVGITNATGANVKTVYSSAFGEQEQLTHTYAAVSSDNTFAENKWLQLGATFGDGGKLKANNSWDITNDDGTNASTIAMTGLDADNNIYMHQTNALNLYAKAKFNATEVRNNEKYGKFGLTVTTANNDGFLFFVDASGSGKDMTGIGLSYVKKVGGNWAWPETSVGSVENKGAYQGENFVELAIYRQGGVFVLYLNGVKKATISGVVNKDIMAYVGIASFNIMINCKEYSISDKAEDLADKVVEQSNVDYLFLGDSYVDRGFWNTYNQGFSSLSAANIGIGGTKTDFWTSMLDVVNTQYNPKNIVIHIGINDINDGNQAATIVIDRLNKLLTAYKNQFPQANLFYVSLSPNNFRPANWSICKEVNAAVKAKATEDAKLTYIDVAQYIGAESGVKVAQYFMPDGLHFNSDGYAIWNREIFKALNLSIPSSETLNLGDNGVYAASNGWTITDEKAENIGMEEQQLYIKNINNTEFYSSIDINVKGKTKESDQFTKIGLAMKSATKTVYYYIDAVAPFTNKWGNMVVRKSGADWDWGHQVFQSFKFMRDAEYKNNFKTIGILKIGNAIYAFADGKAIMYTTDLFGAEEKVSVSVMTFNLNVEAKNAIGIVDKTLLTAKMTELGIAAQSNVTIDGDLKEWTVAQKANYSSIPLSEGRSLKVYNYMAADGVYIGVDAITNKFGKGKNEWFLNTNIEFQLGNGGGRYVCMGQQSRWEPEGARDVGQSNVTNKLENDKNHTMFEIFIPYVMIEGYNYNSAFIPFGYAYCQHFGDGDANMEKGNIWDMGSFYWFNPESAPGDRNLRIIKSADVTLDRVIDADIADWTGTTLTNKKTVTVSPDGVSITGDFNSFLGSDGVYIFATITSAKIKADANSADWWKNTNLEFKLKNTDGTSKIMLYNNAIATSGKIAKAAYKLNATGTKLEVELFIPYSVTSLTATSEQTSLYIGGQINDGANHFCPFAWDNNFFTVTKAGIKI